jgi:GMP synthase-like glutamine amidotransferase
MTRLAFVEHSEWDRPGHLATRAADLDLTVTRYRADRGKGALPPVGSYDLLVVLGSAASVYDQSVSWIADERAMVAEAVAGGVPVLGICFGGQLLAQVLGGSVAPADRPEIGWRLLDSNDPVLVPAGPWVVWHHDAFTAPPGSEVLARSEVCLHAFSQGLHTGVQFHPEVTKEMVSHWIDDAAAGTLTAEQVDELLAGFDHAAEAARDRAVQLFDGWLATAGFPS